MRDLIAGARTVDGGSELIGDVSPFRAARAAAGRHSEPLSFV